MGKPTQSMVPHLSKCVLVGLDIRNCAVQEINDKKTCCENPPNPPILGHLVSMPLSTIMMASGYPPSSLSALATPSGSPSPSPLLMSALLLNIDQPAPKHARVSSFTSPDSSQSLAGRVWNALLQQEFGEDFCKLLITTHSSWNTMHNPQVQSFVDKWILGVIIPDC